jgi:hypothetical protein
MNREVSIFLIGKPSWDVNDAILDSVLLVIDCYPEVFAGHDTSISIRDQLALYGIAKNTSSTYWNSLGDGSFKNHHQLNTTYTPGESDTEVGSTRIVLTGFAIDPLPYVVSDTLTLKIGEALIGEADIIYFYPNPADKSDKLYIISSSQDLSKVKEILFTNMLGQILKPAMITILNKNLIEVSLLNLRSGSYIISLDGRQLDSRLIVSYF